MLSTLNAHPRDEDISFEEGPHIYTVLGRRNWTTSVTTWNHKHFATFDADAIIDKMMKSKKWTDPQLNKYYGMTRDQIKEQWDNNRDAASSAGTQMHADIEAYYNNIPVVNDSKEYSFFERFLRDHPELKPFRTEWMVYYDELRLSGSIDMVFENPDGTLLIYDWKRCKEIKNEPEFGKYAITPCISHLPDTNFWHYALQLNMYKRILEDKYGRTVVGLYLVCLHPDNPYQTYERIEVPVLTKEMDDLVALRKEEIKTV
jgi:ATP-dependent exoDNAse (exonuclease V) beta subunit